VVAFVELNRQERMVLGRNHPEIAGYGSALAIVCERELKDQTVGWIRHLVELLNGEMHRETEELVERLLLSIQLPSRHFLAELAEKQAQMRARVLRDYPAYTDTDLFKLTGGLPDSGDPTQLTTGWRASGQVFGVRYRAESLYLAFQFDNAFEPLPVMSQILEEFNEWDDWEKAIWFVTDNSLLQHQRPAELVRHFADSVLRAARVDARIRRQRRNRSNPRRRGDVAVTPAATPYETLGQEPP
jgi:hypothetical protein